MSFDLQLRGMRALVSGGTKGVRAAVVRGLHAAGVRVMTAARSLPPTVVDGVVYVAADLTTAEVRNASPGRFSDRGVVPTSSSA